MPATFNTENGGGASVSQCIYASPRALLAATTSYYSYYPANTLSESVVMLMEGFLAVTAVLEPHLLLRPAMAPESCSPSALPVPGDNLLPGGEQTNKQNR